MSRSGPVTKDTTTVALGLAQIRVGPSAANIASIDAVLTASNSIGALANTKFMGSVDYWRLESGFPLLEDMTVPLREKASLECAFKELTPQNLAFARGLDATTGYAAAHSGEIRLGTLVAPSKVRMEAMYTYPDGTNKMYIVFPRAEAVSSVEVDLQAEDAAAVPVTFESKRADAEVSGGNSLWDDKPLGRIYWTTS